MGTLESRLDVCIMIWDYLSATGAGQAAIIEQKMKSHFYNLQDPSRVAVCQLKLSKLGEGAGQWPLTWK